MNRQITSLTLFSLLISSFAYADKVEKFRIVNGSDYKIEFKFADPNDNRKSVKTNVLAPGAYWSASGNGPSKLSVRRYGLGSSVVSNYSTIDCDAIHKEIATVEHAGRTDDRVLWIIKPTWFGWSVELEYEDD